MSANMHAANRRMSTADRRMVASRKRSTGRNGLRCLRSCHDSRASETIAVRSSRPLVVDIQAKRWPPEVSQNSVLNAAVAKSPTPATSAPLSAGGCRSPGGSRQSRHAANAAIGRLARKSHRQLTCDTTKPPMTGPVIAAVLNINAK